MLAVLVVGIKFASTVKWNDITKQPSLRSNYAVVTDPDYSAPLTQKPDVEHNREVPDSFYISKKYIFFALQKVTSLCLDNIQ